MKRYIFLVLYLSTAIVFNIRCSNDNDSPKDVADSSTDHSGGTNGLEGTEIGSDDTGSASLIVGTWKCTTSASPPINEVTTFKADGTYETHISGQAYCYDIKGRYELSGNKLSLLDARQSPSLPTELGGKCGSQGWSTEMTISISSDRWSIAAGDTFVAISPSGQRTKGSYQHGSTCIRQ